MPIDNSVDPSKVERHEQRFGEDPVLAARQEENRKNRQKPAREYFENTLRKATKITHGLGTDRFGMPIIQTYHPLDKDFSSSGIFMAEKLLMVYFLKEWYSSSNIEIDGLKGDGKMIVFDDVWKYSLTSDHWVEVRHGAE